MGITDGIAAVKRIVKTYFTLKGAGQRLVDVEARLAGIEHRIEQLDSVEVRLFAIEKRIDDLEFFTSAKLPSKRKAKKKSR